MSIDTVRTLLGINNDDGDGGVTATIERKLETIMRRKIQFDPGAKGIVIGDHQTSIADRHSTGRVGSFTHAPAVSVATMLSLRNDDLGYETNCFVCE